MAAALFSGLEAWHPKVPRVSRGTGSVSVGALGMACILAARTQPELLPSHADTRGAARHRTKFRAHSQQFQTHVLPRTVLRLRLAGNPSVGLMLLISLKGLV